MDTETKIILIITILIIVFSIIFKIIKTVLGFGVALKFLEII